MINAVVFGIRTIALLVTVLVQGAAGPPEKSDRRIDALIEPLIGKATPGVAALVIHRGEVVHHRGLRAC